MKKYLISGLLISLIGFFLWNGYELANITINGGLLAALYLKTILLAMSIVLILALVFPLYFSVSGKKLINNDSEFFGYAAILVLGMIIPPSIYYGVKGNLFLLATSGFFLYLIFRLYNKIRSENIKKFNPMIKELTSVINKHYDLDANCKPINEKETPTTVVNNVLDEVFTAESICSKCSGQLEIYEKKRN